MSGKNTITRNVAQKSIFESAKSVIGATTSFDQGDHLFFDTVNHVLAKPAAEADGVTYLGIARVTVALGKLASPYAGLTDVDASVAISDVPGPLYGVIAKCVLKTGDSLNPGDGVYLDPATGTRGVQAAGTKIIGIYQGKAIAAAAAGTEIEVLIGARYIGDVLKF
jgi:hypothetical protein